MESPEIFQIISEKSDVVIHGMAGEKNITYFCLFNSTQYIFIMKVMQMNIRSRSFYNVGLLKVFNTMILYITIQTNVGISQLDTVMQ